MLSDRPQCRTDVASASLPSCARIPLPRPGRHRSDPKIRSRREDCCPPHSLSCPLQSLQTRRLCEGEFRERVRRKPGAGSATRRRPPLVLGQLPDEIVECDAETNATVALVKKFTSEMANHWLTLVAWRNVTNGRVDITLLSCSAPIIMPLSMRTAAVESDILRT